MRKVLTLMVTIGLIISSSIGVSASTLEKESKAIPIEEIVIDIPQVEAWETDTNGNVKKVTPKSHLFNESGKIPKNSMKSEVGTLAVPNDGYTYVFKRYEPDYVQKNLKYKSTGTFYVTNDDSTPMENVKYEQTTTKTTSASLSVNIDAKATIKQAFFAKLEASLGISVAGSKTWSYGRTYGASKTIKPYHVGQFAGYAVGANSNGRLVWEKRSPDGTSWMGYYYETAGGTAICDDDFHLYFTQYPF